jgi:hypothetical protein
VNSKPGASVKRQGGCGAYQSGSQHQTPREQLKAATPVHAARRTFAKLALKGGARLEQIQLSLGHASIRTTERYLGVEQDLTDAPCDRLGLRLSEAAAACRHVPRPTTRRQRWTAALNLVVDPDTGCRDIEPC